MSDIYLSITETPAVVTLTNPLISSNVAQSVTVTNVVSVNVVTMPAITVQAAAPAVTTVAGTVAVSNFPASQVVSVSNFPASSAITIANFPSVTTVTGTVALDSASLIALENVTVTVGAAVTVSNFPSTQTIAGTVTANVDGDWGVVVTSGIVGGTLNSGVIDLTGYPINSLIEATLQISGGSAVRKFQEIDSQGQYPGADITLTKTFDGSTVINLDPANSPSGVYVFRNPGGYIRFSYVSAGQGTNTQSYKIRAVRDPYYGLNRPISGTVTVGNSVTVGSLPAISGTVTARLQDASGNNLTSTSIGGVQRLNVSLASAATPGGSLPSFVNVYGGTDGSAVRTISVDSTGRQNTNVQLPRVTFIDGSGTVATANTAITVFASSSTRSYLLVQVTTGSAFVNVGATATTVNGINLTAGQGYAWETTIPQGIVSIISTTTSSRYVAKEA